jgi:hypothetical protein
MNRRFAYPIPMSPVDAQVVRPRTGFYGQRGVEPVFGSNHTPRQPDAPPQIDARQVAFSFADEVGIPRNAVRPSRDQHDRAVILIPISSSFLAHAAIEHARQQGVEAFTTQDPRGQPVVAYVVVAQYGLLYAARPYNKPMESVPGDPILTRSARTGYRGGRGPWDTSAVGSPSGSPKPDFETFGMSHEWDFDEFGRPRFKSCPEPGFTGVVEAVGHIVLSGLTLGLFYKLLGGSTL